MPHNYAILYQNKSNQFVTGTLAMAMSKPSIVQYTEREQLLRVLAQEIVKNIRDAPDILREFNISEAEYIEIEQTATFKSMLRAAMAEWEAANNTHERVKLKSATMIEQALPDLYAEISNRGEPLSSRVALVQTLAKLGGLGQSAAPVAGDGQVFKLQINLGTPEKNIVIENIPAVEVPSIEFEGMSDD